mmetsp:Transcript_4198/g.7130  ORF Transcript_4198/g.7130 Transcript_4198/m.7130 type:complete len:290 (+) Transcript_4198:774-1643(+)
MADPDLSLVHCTWQLLINPSLPQALNLCGTLILTYLVHLEIKDLLLSLVVVLDCLCPAGVKVLTALVQVGLPLARHLSELLLQVLAFLVSDGVVLLKSLAGRDLVLEHLILATVEVIHDVQVLDHLLIRHVGRWEVLLARKVDDQPRLVHGLTRNLVPLLDDVLPQDAVSRVLLDGIYILFLDHGRVHHAHCMCLAIFDHLHEPIQLGAVLVHLGNDGWQDGLINQGLDAMDVCDLITVNTLLALASHKVLHLCKKHAHSASMTDTSLLLLLLLCLQALGNLGLLHEHV